MHKETRYLTVQNVEFQPEKDIACVMFAAQRQDGGQEKN